MGACAQEGVVVQKLCRPAPFYLTAGIDGSYRFVLRDAQGVFRPQLVTPEVFERYANGDQFNDLQSAPMLRLVNAPKTSQVLPRQPNHKRYCPAASHSDH